VSDRITVKGEVKAFDYNWIYNSFISCYMFRFW